MTNNVALFKACQWIGHCTALTRLGSHTDRKAGSCVASSYSSDKPTWHFTKMDHWKRKLAKKKKKKMKNSALLCLRLFNILVRKMNIEVSITFFFNSLYHSYLLCLLSQFPNESDISDGADSLKMYIFRKICFFIIELRHIGVWKHSLRLKMQKLKFPCVQLLTCPIPWGCPTQTLLMDWRNHLCSVDGIACMWLAEKSWQNPHG